jgi:arsenical pump membrane protein
VARVVTPRASLATLLWYEQCRSVGVRIPWRRSALTGAVTATAARTAATAARLVAAG